MLKWLSGAGNKFNSWLNNNDDAHPGSPHIIPRDQHNISRKDISRAALNVIAGLRKGGHQGFLVGGGVRDLLLGGHPKDFDVATDATPEQIVQLFRGARIIGRRFKIVHVRFGREVIEVTTFRSNHSPKPVQEQGRPGNKKSVQSESGMLLRDNVFGTVEDDAIRRDFTINALYYTTADFAIYDYTGGLYDLEHKIIRIIGDPATRYREDPVRMLRAARFAAKLGFDIEEHTAAAMPELASCLRDIPAARLFDEVLKLFMSGQGLDTYKQLKHYGLFAHLFPETGEVLASNAPMAEPLIEHALSNTDKRINQGKPVTPAFIFAALLWPAVHRRHLELMAERIPEVPALHQASQEVASRQQQHTAVPKRFGIPMREIWDLQLRLPRRSGKRAQTLFENRRFRAAYDFLLLREQAGEETGNLGQWWTDYQNQPENQRDQMAKSLRPPANKRRRPRKPQPNNE
ncbi:polynucleotide adenylyltransferase PcnB [Dasania marina]|uniref:polynucleotide adenylyltransferase PcnB n=1 Tax=Dasania marina TaxID=471499 RepID=UPI000380FE5D|nr:polynucleotide adenylyltransferase PcnB [Dasania marina]